MLTTFSTIGLHQKELQKKHIISQLLKLGVTRSKEGKSVQEMSYDELIFELAVKRASKS